MLDLANEVRRGLLDLARASIHSRLLHGPLPGIADELRFRAGGAFVTLHVAGDLRGCIGSIGDHEPTGDIVRRCAHAAAFEDPRFPAIRVTELTALRIEISVLSPLEPAGDPPSLVVGRHGLVVELGTRRGLLLPQVAAERGWTAEEFLRQTSLKAGLEPHGWQAGASVYRFEAEVFGEGT